MRHVWSLISTFALVFVASHAFARDEENADERYGFEIELKQRPLGQILIHYALPSSVVYDVWAWIKSNPGFSGSEAYRASLEAEVDELPLHGLAFLRRLPVDMQERLGVSKLAQLNLLPADTRGEVRAQSTTGLYFPGHVQSGAIGLVEVAEAWRTQVPMAVKMHWTRLSDLSPDLRTHTFLGLRRLRHGDPNLEFYSLKLNRSNPAIAAALNRFQLKKEMRDESVAEVVYHEGVEQHSRRGLLRDIQFWGDLTQTRSVLMDLPAASTAAWAYNEYHGIPHLPDENEPKSQTNRRRVIPVGLHYDVQNTAPGTAKSVEFFKLLNFYWMVSRIHAGTYNDITGGSFVYRPDIESKGLIKRRSDHRVEIRAHILPLEEELDLVASLMRQNDREARERLHELIRPKLAKIFDANTLLNIQPGDGRHFVLRDLDQFHSFYLKRQETMATFKLSEEDMHAFAPATAWPEDHAFVAFVKAARYHAADPVSLRDYVRSRLPSISELITMANTVGATEYLEAAIPFLDDQELTLLARLLKTQTGVEAEPVTWFHLLADPREAVFESALAILENWPEALFTANSYTVRSFSMEYPGIAHSISRLQPARRVRVRAMLMAWSSKDSSRHGVGESARAILSGKEFSYVWSGTKRGVIDSCVRKVMDWSVGARN